MSNEFESEQVPFLEYDVPRDPLFGFAKMEEEKEQPQDLPEGIVWNEQKQRYELEDQSGGDNMQDERSMKLNEELDVGPTVELYDGTGSVRLATENEIQEINDAGELYWDKEYRSWLPIKIYPEGEDLIDGGPYDYKGEDPATDEEKKLIDEYDFKFNLKEIRDNEHLKPEEEEKEEFEVLEIDNTESIYTEEESWNPNLNISSKKDETPPAAELIGGKKNVKLVGPKGYNIDTEGIIEGGWKEQGFDMSYQDWLNRNPLPMVEGTPFENEAGEMETPMVYASRDSQEYKNWAIKREEFLSQGGSYLAYDPHKQTSEKRINDIGNLLYLPENWQNEIGDLNDGNFIRGKRNIYMINHPQYEFPKFIQFTNARPQGFILTIDQVKEIIKDDVN